MDQVIFYSGLTMNFGHQTLCFLLVSNLNEGQKPRNVLYVDDGYYVRMYTACMFFVCVGDTVHDGSRSGSLLFSTIWAEMTSAVSVNER